MKTSQTKQRTNLWRGWVSAAPSLVVLLILVIYPLATLFVQTFLPHLFDVKMSTALSLRPLFQSLSDKLNCESLVNSFVMGVVASILATILGTITAFGTVRSSKKMQIVLDVMVWIIFFAPSYVIAQGWLLFMQDGGIAAQIFGLPIGWSSWFFTKGGIVAAMGLRYFPFVHIAMVQAVKNMGSEFGRAGQSLGASRIRVFFRITLPLLAPGLLAGASIAFAEGFGDFGFASAIAPQMHIPLLTYQIYSALNEAPVNYAAAASLSIVLILVMSAVLWFQMWWLKRGSYTTVSSSSAWNLPAKPRRTNWQTVVALVISVVGFVIPVFSTIASSLWKTNADGIGTSNWTLEAYRKIFQLGSDGLNSMIRSITYSVIAAVIVMVVALYISYQLERRKSTPMKVVNVVTMSTIAVPGVVLAAGFIFAWNARWLIPAHLVLYGTPICLAMAYIAGSLPYAIRLNLGAITQLSPSLVTAAQVLGARQRVVLWKIILPIISSTVVSTFFITLTGTMFELPASSLLYPAGSPPYPVVIQQQFNGFNFQEGSALATIGLIVVLLMYTLGRFTVSRMSFTRRQEMERKSEGQEPSYGALNNMSTVGE